MSPASTLDRRLSHGAVGWSFGPVGGILCSMSKQPDPQPGDAVDALTEGMQGRWLVQSRNTSHEFDLDSMTYTRRPSPTSSQHFPDDGEVIHLGEIVTWPKVGRRHYIVYDDPDCPLMDQWRISSPITSITRLPDAGSEGDFVPGN